MKKTLAAVAVLGAFAGSALAADVTLYGRVDTGFQYNHTNTDIELLGWKGGETASAFSMESGQSSGSRWGLKGVEDLGAFKVGFILEDGFTSDNGAEKGVMFDRESALFIQGDFGKLAVGRIGSIVNGTGSWAQLGAASVFGTSYGNAAVSQILFADGVRDNMIAYQTPTVAGITGFVQYSMGTNDEGENESTTDRYYAIGATYANGPLNALLAVDSVNYKTYYGTDGHGRDINDSLTVTAAVNYDFDVAKVYFAAQYFDEVTAKNDFGAWAVVDDLLGEDDAVGIKQKVKGYSLSASVAAPVAGGTLMAGLGYMDASGADSTENDVETCFGVNKFDVDLKRYQVGVAYSYPLSKRTSVYAAASAIKDKVTYTVSPYKLECKETKAQAMFGLLHTF